MDATASLICDGLIEHAIKSVLVVGLVFLCLWALETRLPAGAKKFALLGATLLVLLLPLTSRWTPTLAELRVWTVWSASHPGAVPATDPATLKDDSRASAIALGTSRKATAVYDLVGDPLKIVVIVWLAGVAAFAARWIHQIVSSERQSRLLRSQEAQAVDQDRVAQEATSLCDAAPVVPPAYLLPEVESPVVLGIANPVVLLPVTFVDWPPEQQCHVLRHELSHVHHRDILWRQVASLATVAFWFNPFVWVLKRRLQLEQERSCDDAVIRSGIKPSDYCETLLVAGESRVSNAAAAGTGEADEIRRESNRTLLRIARDQSTSLLNERVLAAINAGTDHRRASPAALVFITLALIVIGWQFSSVRLLTTWAGVMPVTLQIRVSSTSDDAEERAEDGLVDLASRDLEMPYDRGRDWLQLIGVRFDDVEIPAGARIDHADISFTGLKTGRGAPELEIAVQVAPGAATFRARPRDISNRVSPDQDRLTWTPSYVPSEDGQHTTTTTPDLSILVQQVVNQPGWSAGNAIAFVISGEAGEVCRAVSYDSSNGAQLAPVLSVTYVDEVSVFLRPRQD